MNINKNKNIIFSNPAASGYQTFKKILGATLLAISLYLIISLSTLGVKLINGEINFQQNSLIQQILPELLEDRTLVVKMPAPDNQTELNSKIEIPKTFFMIPALLLIVFVFGIIARLIIAVLSAGVSLMRDDVAYVFERLRKEIENNKVSTKIDP